MTKSIHPTAIVGAGAEIGDDVSIGPYCIVGDNVRLAEGVNLISHVTVVGHTTIGPRTRIFPFASIGHEPQDLKYAGEPSTVIVGADCTIREHVTINPGTAGGGMETRIGDNCLLMIGVHVAHDCRVGNHVVLANQVGLSGHCQVDDYVRFGGMCGVHQFVRIGAHAFVGGLSKVNDDVIPYGMVVGNPGHLGGLNLVGLKRRGFSRDAIHALRAAYRAIFTKDGTLSARVDAAAETFKGERLVEELIAFIRAPSQRSLCLPRNGADLDDADL